MEGKSKLINVQPTGTFKEMYKFELEFEDGTTGVLYRKTNESKVEKGTEYPYSLNDKGTIKIVNPNYAGGNSGGGKQYSDDDKARMAKSVAIKTAGIIHANRNTTNADILADADVFYEYITGSINPNAPKADIDDNPF